MGDMHALPPQSPQAPAAAPSQKSALARLALLIPIAMAKGGPAAVSGLVNGYHQTLARNQQMGQQQEQQNWTRQMQTSQLQSLDESRRQQAEDRQAGIEDRRLGQQRQFMEQVRTSAGNPDLTEEEAFQRMEMLVRQAPQYGVSALDVEQASYVAPTRREKAQISRMLTDVDKMYPATPEREALKLANGMTVGEARQKIAMVSGQAPPIAKPPANAVNAGSFEDYVMRYAKDKGVAVEGLTSAQIEDARKRYQQSDDRPRITVNTGGASDPRTNARIDRIVSSFNQQPIVKEFNEVQAQHGIIKTVVNGPWSGPNDMAAVFAFMKALDPNSVVRESEYATASKSGNIFTGWAARFNGAVSEGGGFLSDRVRHDFLRTIESRLGVKSQQYQNLRKQLVARIDRIKAGAPETGDEALIDYAAATAPDPAAPAAHRNPMTDRVLPPNLRSGGTGAKVGRFIIETEP